MARGGARKGAGRPLAHHEPIGFRLRPDTIAELRRTVLRHERSEFVDEAIRAKLGLPLDTLKPISPN